MNIENLLAVYNDNCFDSIQQIDNQYTLKQYINLYYSNRNTSLEFKITCDNSILNNLNFFYDTDENVKNLLNAKLLSIVPFYQS